MENIELVANILDNFFYGVSIFDLWRCCTNQMLWEAIKQADAQIIAQENIGAFLLQQRAFFLLPEPLPAIISLNSFEYVYIDLAKDEFDIHELFKQEPMYIVDGEFKWMIVLTTENTQSGTQLCVLVHSKSNLLSTGRFTSSPFI